MALFTEVYGQGETTVVFLHGGGVSGWMWTRQVEYFRSKYRLLVPDLPGHGQSSDIPWLSMQDAAQQVLEMIRSQAGNRRIVLVGLSLGAQLVVQLLSQEPDLAEVAVINSALVQPMAMAVALTKPMLAISLPLIKNRAFAKLQARQLYVGPELFEQYFRDSQLISAANLTKVLEANMSYTLPQGFAQCQAKVLTMVGEKERGVMLQSGAKIALAAQNGIGVVVPGIGHGVSLANPELFNQVVDAWIEGKELPRGLRAIAQ